MEGRATFHGAQTVGAMFGSVEPPAARETDGNIKGVNEGDINMGVIGHHKENPDLYLPQIGQGVTQMSWVRGLFVILGGGCLLPPQCPASTKKAQLLSQQGSAMATTMTASSASPITIINSFITQPHTASAAISAKPQPLEKFYKGEPLALGVSILCTGAASPPTWDNQPMRACSDDVVV